MQIKLPLWVGFLAICLVLLPRIEPAAQDFQILGLAQNSQPKYIVSENQAGGLCMDIYRHLKSKLKHHNITLMPDTKYTPIKRIFRDIEAEISKIFCGAGRNAGREKRFSYSPVPLYTVSKIVITHKDDAWNPGSFEDIAKSSARIGSLFGTSSLKYLQSRQKLYPDLNIDNRIHDLDTAFKMVANKSVRYFYYHDLGLLYLIRKSPLPLRAVPTRLRTTPHWMIYKKTLPDEIRRALDRAITRMVRNGSVKKIWKKYKPSS